MTKNGRVGCGGMIGTLTVLGGCFLGVLALQAAEYRDYPCYQLAKAPTLDGRLEPEVWANIPEVGGSYFLQRDERLAERPAWFKAGWTPDAVWIAARCKEPAMATLRVAGGDTLWKDDSIEICCVPPGGRLQYIVNAAGAQWQAKGSHVMYDGMGEWQARVGKDADGWTLEIKIPFNDFGVTPGDRAQWSFTLARYIPGPASDRPELGTGARIVGGFDRLVFHAIKFQSTSGTSYRVAPSRGP